MALKFPQYLMRDGVTRLSQDYFNPIWRDLDGRLDTLERLKISWESAVSEVQQFGIQRIDTVLAPVIEDITTTLASANAAAAELQQIIEDADIQGQLDAAFDAQNALVQQALDDQEEALTQAIDDAVGAIEGVPAGAIIIWTGTACPAGWSRETTLDGLFLKGAATAAAPNLTPAGSNTHVHSMDHSHGLGSHTHSLPSHTHTMSHTHSGTTGNPNAGSTTMQTGSSTQLYATHTHDFTTSSQSTSTTGAWSGTSGAATGNTATHTGNTASASNEPQHVTVLFCKKD